MVCDPIGFSTLPLITLARSSYPSDLIFALIVLHAFASSSTKSAPAAPRLSASSPMAPVPAYRSRTLAFSTLSPSIEKIAALTFSVVGLSPLFGALRLRPLSLPPEIRVHIRLLVPLEASARPSTQPSKVTR